MSPIWKDHGLNRTGAKCADRAISSMVKAVNESSNRAIAEVVLLEALFIVYELPKRTKRFRDEYLDKLPPL